MSCLKIWRVPISLVTLFTKVAYCRLQEERKQTKFMCLRNIRLPLKYESVKTTEIWSVLNTVLYLYLLNNKTEINKFSVAESHEYKEKDSRTVVQSSLNSILCNPVCNQSNVCEVFPQLSVGPHVFLNQCYFVLPNVGLYC